MVVRNMLPSIIILSSKANSNDETKIIFYVVGKRPFFIFENCDFEKKGLEVAFYVFFFIFREWTTGTSILLVSIVPVRGLLCAT